jgi:hypothetical protein
MRTQRKVEVYNKTVHDLTTLHIVNKPKCQRRLAEFPFQGNDP